MKYVTVTHWGNVAPVLLGTYECELAPIVTRWIADPPTIVVDVGCAEGYYAVGLARASQSTRVYAFDSDPREQDLCRQLASLNDVADRVQIGGHCGHATLQAHLETQGRKLLIVDCEGCEADLLDPTGVPALATTEMLVEFHEVEVPGVTDRVTKRFAPTHRVEVIMAEPRTRVPALVADLEQPLREASVDELRPTHPQPMCWGHLVPLAEEPI